MLSRSSTLSSASTTRRARSGRIGPPYKAAPSYCAGQSRRPGSERARDLPGGPPFTLKVLDGERFRRLLKRVRNSPADDGVLVAAAAATGRRVLGLAPGPRSGDRALAGLAGLDSRLRPLAEVRPGGPAQLLEADKPEAGQAALAIAGGGEPAPGEPAAGPCVLYAACQRVLRPGGVLAVVTASTLPGRAAR